MEKSEFLRYEYLTLREEIKETKARIFKLAGIGIVGMPSAYFFAKAYQLEVLVMSLPILICTVVLLYLSESRALMRCGQYIRTKIEPAIIDTHGICGTGWECWLEEKAKGDRRGGSKRGKTHHRGILNEAIRSQHWAARKNMKFTLSGSFLADG